MTDYVWPSDLVPFQQSFYLQAHSGGSESPFTRQSKIYGLSAPRWITSLSFRGGYNGTKDQAAFGPRLDAWIDKLKGRENRVALYDFRRSRMRTVPWTTGVGNLAVSLGATSVTITGLQPGAVVYEGDYVGGDGRPHRILDTVQAGSSGQAVVNVNLPFKAAVSANALVFGNPTGLFRLVDDDAGQNGVGVGELVTMTLNFVEDLA